MADQDIPWLSVLMPVFNGASSLGETLASVASQAEGIEVIVVDQGSTDGSFDIAASFQDRMNIRIIPAPENKNWVQNTNLALSQARASRACLLHQDDLWRAGRSGILRQMFGRDPDAALWVHGADYIDDQGHVIGHFEPPFGPSARRLDPTEFLEDLIVQNTIALPATAFRVDLARHVGGLDEALWYTADWDFWLTLASHGTTCWVPDRAVAFRLHGNSLTISGSRDLEDLAHQLEQPVSRHITRVPEARRKAASRTAAASNMVNIWLASVFHRDRKPLIPVLWAVLCLGPAGWFALARKSQLAARLWPRIRLMSNRKSE